MGTGRACFETLRPLAYSLLAEIVHHVRGDLSLSQVLHLLMSFMKFCYNSVAYPSERFVVCIGFEVFFF